MKITKVDIQGFGTFSSTHSFSFCDGMLNIVFGGNESGKSTLMEAIYATIFGLEKKEAEESFRSWLPSESYIGSVEFSSAGGTVRFCRDFSSNEVVVSRTGNEKEAEIFRGEASPRSRGEEKRAYADVLRELFGFSEGGLARRTSFVGQLDLETEFTPALRGLISGAGSTDYHGVVESLRNKFAEITVENPWGSVRRKKRALEEIADTLEEKRRELREAGALFRNSSKLAEERSRLEKMIHQLTEKRDGSRDFLGKIQRLVELQGRLGDKRERYKSEQTAKESSERARVACEAAEEKLEKEYPLFGGLRDEVFSALGSTLSRGGSVEENLAEREGELAKRQALLDASPMPLPVWSVGAIPTGVLLLFLVLGFLLDRVGPMSVSGILVSVLLAFGLWFLSRGRRRTPFSIKRDIEELAKEVAALRDNLHSLSEETCRLFPEELRPSLQNRNLRELSAQYSGFRKDKRGVEELKEKLLSHRSADAHETHSDAVEKLAVVQSQLEEFLKDEKELLPLKSDPEKATRMAAHAGREVKEADSELRKLDDKLREIQIQHAGLSASTVGSPETYREEIDWLEKKSLRLTERRDAFKLAVDTLVRCVEEYQAESMNRISCRISELFSRVTGGRYTAVDLSRNEEPLLRTVSRSGIDLEDVSTGTEDQLYFCMRVAMLEELSGEKGLPLILDDPFVNFDDRRLERARQLLSDLMTEKGMQIILFTHENRHLDRDAHIIRLAGC